MQKYIKYSKYTTLNMAKYSNGTTVYGIHTFAQNRNLLDKVLIERSIIIEITSYNFQNICL